MKPDEKQFNVLKEMSEFPHGWWASLGTGKSFYFVQETPTPSII